MSSEHWIIYNVATFAEVMRGTGPKGSAAEQKLPEGLALLRVSQAAALSIPLDLDLVRPSLRKAINDGCGAARALFITDIPAQDVMYQRKAAQAHAYVANPEGDYPALSGEAARRGKTVAEVAAQVLALEAYWYPILDASEAVRTGANEALDAATDLAGLIAAANIDWEAELAPFVS